MSKGKLIIFSAPSGAGKTTIVRHLLSISELKLEFSVSACSRGPRKNEKHGHDYYFLSIEEFKNKIESNHFLEWEEVYDGLFYGTLFNEIDRIINSGNNVLFDVDVKGGISIKNHYADQALAIFVQPPDIMTLEKRLLSRSTDSSEAIADRIAKATYELGFAPQFDEILVNDKLDETFKKAEELVREFVTSK